MKTMEVVCAILEQDGKYLIARRGSGVRENIWEFPGGKVETKETKEEAIIREIKEELELTVCVKQQLCDFMDEREDVTIHVSAFICEKIAGEMKLHAHHEVRFVKPNELFEYTFEKADHILLERLQRR